MYFLLFVTKENVQGMIKGALQAFWEQMVRNQKTWAARGVDYLEGSWET